MIKVSKVNVDSYITNTPLIHYCFPCRCWHS